MSPFVYVIRPITIYVRVCLCVSLYGSFHVRLKIQILFCQSYMLSTILPPIYRVHYKNIFVSLPAYLSVCLRTLFFLLLRQLSFKPFLHTPQFRVQSPHEARTCSPRALKAIALDLKKAFFFEQCLFE